MADTLEVKTKKHCWEKFNEYIPEIGGVVSMFELGAEGFYKISEKMKPNEYYIPTTLPAEITNTYIFNKYIEALKLLGLDIGKGECEFGYKMPLPEKTENRRNLIIFRRKVNGKEEE
jgi:hypothetical protein